MKRIHQWLKSTPLYLLVGSFFVLLLAGRFAFNRVENDPVLHPGRELRFPIFAAVLICWLLVTLQPIRWPRRIENARRWSTWAILFHLYLALGCWWVQRMDEVVLYRLAELVMMAMLIYLCNAVFGSDPDTAIPFFFLLCFGAALAYALGGMSGYWHLDQRSTAFGGGPNIFVRVVGTGIFACLYFWGRTRHALWLLPCPLLLLSAVLSGSRGGMLGLLAGLPLCCYGLWRHTKRHVLLGLFTVAVLATVIICFTPLGEHVQTFWQTRYVNLTFNRHYTSSRDSLFVYARDLFLLHPLVGIGLDGYEQVTGVMYPHNLILNVASEGGLVGLLFMAGSLWWFIPRWFQQRDLEQTVALSVGIFYFVASMFSGTYYDARYMWVFFYLYMLRPATSPVERTNRLMPARRSYATAQVPTLLNQSATI